MSSRDSAGVTQPLLPSSTRQAPSADRRDLYNNDEQVGAVDMVKQENLGRAAWPIQASALLFVALVWSVVFSHMSPLALPLFGYHPLIQSFTVLVMIQAIVVLQRTSAQKSQSEKQAAFKVHQWINILLVLPLFTAGASVMWYLHDQPNAKHFISWHGILGTTLVAWAWIQAAIGAATVMFNGQLLGGPNRAKSFYKYHRYVNPHLTARDLTRPVLLTPFSRALVADCQATLCCLCFCLPRSWA